MKIEKWKYKGEDVDLMILDESGIETNEELEDLEKTQDLTKDLENVVDNNDK